MYRCPRPVGSRRLALVPVVAQNLLKKMGGGRVAALEVLVVNQAVAALIREGKNTQITSIMQTARKEGMTLLNQELGRLVKEEIVVAGEAYSKAVDRIDLVRVFQQESIAFKAPVETAA